VKEGLGRGGLIGEEVFAAGLGVRGIVAEEIGLVLGVLILLPLRNV